MSPADLHVAILARLRTIRSVTVYDSDVPDGPPADAQGRVYPYVVVWGSAGAPWAERRLNGDTDRLDWAPRVTVAAGNTTWLLQSVPLVRGALEGLRIGGATLRDTTDPDEPIQKDPDANPVRFFLAMKFRALTFTP